MRNFWSRCKYYAAVVLFILSSSVISGGPVFANQQNQDNKKVFVCKYVGQPGIDERLQTGQNPIDVSINAIKDYQGPGSYFNDQQGRSFVLAVDAGQATPNVSACPAAQGPTKVTPAAVIFVDNCGTGSDSYTIPSVTGITYQVNGHTKSAGSYAGSGVVNVTAVAQTGFVLNGVTSWSQTYDATACLVPVTPVAVTFADSCGTASDAYTIPSTLGVYYQVNGVTVAAGSHVGTGTVVITAHAQAGYTLTGVTTWSHAFDVTPCIILTTPTAPNISGELSCVQRTETVTAPTIAGVVWSPSSLTALQPGQSATYTATPAPGYAFPANAQTSWTFTNNFNPAVCVVTPGVPNTTQPNCEARTELVSPVPGTGVVWSPSVATTLQPGDSVQYDATPAQGYAFPGNAQTTWSFTNTFNVSQCIPLPIDVCVNLSGLQTELPHGYQLRDGRCVKCHPPVDVCANLPGRQPSVPAGYQLEDGDCEQLPPPPVDVCTNIEGSQAIVPEGMVLTDGSCEPLAQPTAVTAEGVSFTDATCTAAGFYVVPSVSGVVYEDAQGAIIPAGTYSATVGQVVTVTAYPVSTAYTLGGTTNWTHTFTAALDCNGHVLGDNTSTPTTPPVVPAVGHVLAASTTELSDTGTSPVWATLFALLLLTAATAVIKRADYNR